MLTDTHTFTHLKKSKVCMVQRVLSLLSQLVACSRPGFLLVPCARLWKCFDLQTTRIPWEHCDVIDFGHVSCLQAHMGWVVFGGFGVIPTLGTQCIQNLRSLQSQPSHAPKRRDISALSNTNAPRNVRLPATHALKTLDICPFSKYACHQT